MRRNLTKPWFRRRATGLGWRAVTWQGWAVTVAAAGLVVAVLVVLRGSPSRVPVVLAIAAVYAIVALATGARERIGETETVATAPERERPIVAGAPRAVFSADPSQPPALVVEALSKRFGDRVAVDDVSFSVSSGEVFGFLGPNGAGKTTTVRMLATLVAPTSGSAVVAGIPLDRANGVEIRQSISLMPESPGLYLRLTVAENLEFFAGLYGLRRPDARIAQVLESVGLADRAGDLCGTLSKGLRQRVGLARALLNDPAIVFLDEPTSGLDPAAARDVHVLIDSLRARGVTVFLTTHRLEEAERLCDRVAILNTSLRTIGRPDELRDRLFTKALILRTAAPLAAAERTLGGAPGVEKWVEDGSGRYVLTVSDPRTAAPAVIRALVAEGADVLSLEESRHSLEEIYLELVDEKTEARQ